MLKKLRGRVRHFFFAPLDDRPLALFRICLGVMLLVEAVMVYPNLSDLYGPRGFLDATLMRAISGSNLPAYAGVVNAWGISYGTLLNGVFAVRAGAILFFLAGLATRPATIVLWLTQAMLMASGPLSNYGLDRYFHVFLFLLCFLPAGRAFSLDARLGRLKRGPAWLPRFGLRMLQLTLLLTYLNAGVSKSLGAEWWTGDAIWRVLHLPEFRQAEFWWMAEYPLVPKLLSWGTLLFETFYIVGVWVPYVGAAWLLAIIGMHLGIFFLMNLANFGLGMALFNAALFGYPKARAYFTRPGPRRTLVRILGLIAPKPTAAWAHRIFRRTRRYPTPAWEIALKAEGAALAEDIPATWFAAAPPAETILLVHGWGGRGLQLGAFVEPLRRAGFSVLSFDGPGHGEAAGSETDLGEFARAIEALSADRGPFYGVVAHSFGAVAAVLAASRGVVIERFVLVGAPAELETTFAKFAAELGLPDRAFRRFQRLAEARAGVKASATRVGALGAKLSRPCLLLHDEADEIVPFAQAELTARDWPGAVIFPTKGLGHRRILKDPLSIRAAVEFFRSAKV